MRKILTVIVIITIILGGYNTIAIPNDKIIENISLNLQDFALEIVIEGGFLGYSVTIINNGMEQVEGNFTIEILTDSMVVLFGANLSADVPINLNPLNNIESFKLQPLIAFGSTTISVSGIFQTEGGEYPFTTIASGYAFVIYFICEKTSIYLP